ncbi:DGQHR domain-containing protein [Burkholderia ambifaria]|uniref:DGQHR domain-containing protein n=2 Tax=Burkholderia TaxID=32008 RepID=UPI001B9F505A|nr:DGQHR domain-containing protein [Burkholderia ambifaria]MBR8332107.1 DGQHR domain-containing protein [Burkholderia ambifaria]
MNRSTQKSSTTMATAKKKTENEMTPVKTAVKTAARARAETAPTKAEVGGSAKKSTSRKSTTYASLLLTQNRHKFYFTTIPVKDLFEYCFVSRRKEDSIRGFQRELNKSRAEDIAKYLKDGDGSIPTNVVLSSQPESGFSYNRKSKSVSFNRSERSFLVLDGQHRLWGYQLCLERFGIEHRVPVAIYEGLSRTEEARLFIDINTRQVGVPAALLLDIKQVAQLESQKEGIMREIFDQLATDVRSPMVGRLSSAKSVTGKISRVTFNRALDPLFDGPLLRDTSSTKRYGLVLNYLIALSEELGDNDHLLTRSAFFEAIFEVFESVVRQSISQFGDAKPESLRKVVRPLAKYDYSGQALATRGTLKQVMKASLASVVKLTDDML